MGKHLGRLGATLGALFVLTGLLGIVMITSGAGWKDNTEFEWFDAVVKADGIDSTAIYYFAKAGSLTTDPDSLVGYVTYGEFINTENAANTIRLFTKSGTLDLGTTGDPDSAYVAVTLSSTDIFSPQSTVFTIPPGLRVTGMMCTTDPGAGGIVYRVGR